jgi:hemolysin D
MNISYQFDQPVLLRQSSTWSRVIAWGITSITAFTIIWALVFQIDESIPVSGKFEPQAPVTDIQAPVGGVVKQIHVSDGQEVKKGDILITLDQSTIEAQLTSLQKNRDSLVQENEFYQSYIAGDASQKLVHLSTVDIPAVMVSLTQNRAALIAENHLYRAQLNNSTKGIYLTSEQKFRLQNRQLETKSRLQVATLEIGQTKEQLQQTQAQAKGTKQALKINQDILNRYQWAANEGAFSRVEVLRQRQHVEGQQTEINRLTKEAQRLKLAIIQAQEKLNNTEAQSKEDLLSRVTANEKSIAQINSQVTKVIIENQKKINEIDSQITQAKSTMNYKQIISPTDGTVFELKSKTPGFVANSSEPILKIVPKDNLIAKIQITNRDIGFIKDSFFKQDNNANSCDSITNKKGNQTNSQYPPVDVRIDSYPFQQYGDIKGRLIWIGSDALPPDQINSYWRFPAKVCLDRQTMLLSNNGELPLQSGMSINANIKLRKRTVMSIFTDFLVKKADSLKFLR